MRCYGYDNSSIRVFGDSLLEFVKKQDLITALVKLLQLSHLLICDLSVNLCRFIPTHNTTFCLLGNLSSNCRRASNIIVFMNREYFHARLFSFR